MAHAARSLAAVMVATLALIATVATLVVGSASAAAPSVSAIAAGNNQSCTISGGDVSCWGDNASGQLGNGSLTGSTVAVAGPTGDPLDFTAVTSGEKFACALDTDGRAWCWGENENFQLGDGTTNDSATAVEVDLPPGVQLTKISAGTWFTCGIDSTDAVWCWGYGLRFVDGGSPINSHPVPAQVPGLANVADISAGAMHACAIADGDVKCWGNNGSKQLGDRAGYELPDPDLVPGLASGAITVAAGSEHTCAVITGGAVWCWGANGYGQLGVASPSQSATPIEVTDNTNGYAGGITAIDAGWSYTCAIDSGGSAWCWGYNGSGQLGMGSWVMASVAPVTPTGMTSGVTAISAGAAVCAVQNSVARCWGSNQYGQVGIGNVNTTNLPGDVHWQSEVVVSAPADNSVTTDSTTSVHYSSAGWPQPSCTVAGSPLASPAIVNLQPGLNAISVSCSNASSAASVVVNVTRNQAVAIGGFSATGDQTTDSQTTLTYSVSGWPAPTCTIGGDPVGPSPAQRSLVVGPQQFTLVCENSYGGDDFSDSEQVSVERLQAPEFTLDAPSDDLRTTDTSVDVEFEVTAGHPAPTCTVGGDPATSPHTFALDEGDNAIAVSCTNSVDSDEQTVSVFRGRQASVNLSSPADGSFYAAGDEEATFVYTSDGNPAPTCTVNGDPVGPSPANVSLEYGPNVFTLACSNEFNASSPTITLNRLQPPTLTIDSPADGYETTDGSVEVAFHANGFPQPSCTYESQPAASPLTVALPDPGELTVTIHCSNAAGSDSKSITLVHNVAPNANLGLPNEGPVVSSEVVALPYWATGHPTPACTVGGNAANASPAQVSLVPGPQTVALVCTNTVGTITKSVEITRNVAPIVTIVSPDDGLQTLEDEVTLEFTATGYPEPSCTFENAGAIPGTPINAALIAGLNLLAVHCSNQGDSGSAQVSVFRHSPLTVSVTAPVDGLSTLGGQVNVAYLINGTAAIPPGTTCTVAGAASADPAVNSVSLAAGANAIAVVCSNPLVTSTASVVVTRLVPVPVPLAPPKISGAPKSVKAGKAIAFRTTCTSACTVTPTLKIGKKKIKGIKAVKAGAGSNSVKLKLPSRVVRQIKAALKKRKRTKVVLTLTPRSADGIGRAAKLRIR